jgi:hypothetical protein
VLRLRVTPSGDGKRDGDRHQGSGVVNVDVAALVNLDVLDTPCRALPRSHLRPGLKECGPACRELEQVIHLAATVSKVACPLQSV